MKAIGTAVLGGDCKTYEAFVKAKGGKCVDSIPSSGGSDGPVEDEATVAQHNVNDDGSEKEEKVM